MPLNHLIVLIANGHHYLLASADLAFSLALEGVPKLNRARINLTERRAKNRITFYNPVHHDKSACDPRGNDPHELVRSTMSIDVFSTRPHAEGYAGTLRGHAIKETESNSSGRGERGELREPERSGLSSVSTGSAEDHTLQPAMANFGSVSLRPASLR